MNRTINRTMLIAAVSLSAVCFSGQLQAAESAKTRLIQNIGEEQTLVEKKIIQMWMSGQRGKEFELVLADYVSREVRYRAMTGEVDGGTLLAAVNAEQESNVTNPLELGRLLVLEYFKRKGVNLKGKRFIKGNYTIGLKKDVEQQAADTRTSECSERISQ